MLRIHYCLGPEPETYKPDDDTIPKVGPLVNGRETSPVQHADAARTTSSSSNEIAGRPTILASDVTSGQKDDEKMDGGASCKLSNILVFCNLIFSFVGAVAKTTSPEVSAVPSPIVAKATVSDNLQHEASSSEDTDDNPLPVGGHEDNPSDSGTTSDDDELEDEVVNQPPEVH